MSRKIVILSAKAGSGHIVAANGLEQAFSSLTEGTEVLNANCFRFFAPWAIDLYGGAYSFLTTHTPTLWRVLFNHFSAPSSPKNSSCARSLARALQDRLTREMPARIEAEKPDAVVATHFMPGQVLAGIKRSYPLYVVITDYFVHGVWINKGVDRYFVGSPHSAEMAARYGVESRRISVTGLPVRPPFAKKIDKTAARKDLGIGPEQVAVLVMSGGLGADSLSSIAAIIARRKKPMALITIAASNAAQRRKLAQMKWPSHVKHVGFGFTGEMAKIMAASDLVVTKAGGLTVAESLCMGLPMLLLPPIPGHEAGNARWLLENGAALIAANLRDLAWKAETLLFNSRLRLGMAEQSRRLGLPDAARTIAENILAGL